MIGFVDSPTYGPTLFIDHSTLEPWLECPYKGYIKLVERKKRDSASPALRYGGAVHAALAYRYRMKAVKQEVDWDHVNSKMIDIVARYMDSNPCAFEEWRNLDQASALLALHAQLNDRSEDFTIAKLSGFPFVEKSFVVDLGTIVKHRVFYVGRIDLVVKHDSNIFVLDHKTTSMIGDGFWTQQRMSSQFLGYCYVLKQLGFQVTGYIVNALVTRKPTRTGINVDNERRTFFLDPSWDVQWRSNVTKQIGSILTALENNLVFQNRSACVGKYSVCEFCTLCQQHPDSHAAELSSRFYTTNTWTPLMKPPVAA